MDSYYDVEVESTAKPPTTEQLVQIWYPRATGFITFMSSLRMLWIAWGRRKGLFHRLVLGMASWGVVFGVCFMLGSIAIPREYSEFYGNFGTIATCSAQGFFVYVSGRAGMLYYASFSVYSYLGVLHNFHKHKYAWCEKWIHVLVHVYPIAMATYFLATEEYNPGYGFCKQTSYPIGCLDSEETQCERGRNFNGGTELFLFWILPCLLYPLMPTCVMLKLYLKVKKHEKHCERTQSQDEEQSEHPQSSSQPIPRRAYAIPSRSIAVQACIYLSALYLTLIPFFLLSILPVVVEDNSLVVFTAIAQINFSLFFFWTMLVYRHFTTEDVMRSGNDPTKDKDEREKNQDTNNRGSFLLRMTSLTQRTFSFSGRPSTAAEFIFNPEENSGPIALDVSVHPEEPERRCSFNIFDGTNASGQFSEFIFEGDSDDERIDREETERWSSIQGRI